ncbi:hypothetical protein EVAR_84026_1 [Eumeta japonica]|uniref:Uncharacterized protein n=1 Tax=Eumeta variegata TaxID=151549 RepID=A0A4C1X512_EUMVA|nr:hypothetical protein EVAR_84026_1 [Eumeta japonica]
MIASISYISMESIAIEFSGELDKSSASPAVSLELNSSSDAKEVRDNTCRRYLLARATDRRAHGEVVKKKKGYDLTEYFKGFRIRDLVVYKS